MARGEQELYCLNFIKEHLESDSMFYGMSKEDCDRIEKMILSAVPNPRSSEFPDFICDGGFIEHFQISSGKTTKKGSLHKQNEAKFNNDYETGLEEFMAHTLLLLSSLTEMTIFCWKPNILNSL